MPFQKGDKWKGNKQGRPVGASGKFSDLKESFYDAYDQAGGTERLVEICKDDPKKFMELVSVIARLLPKEQKLDFYAKIERIDVTNKSREEIIRELTIELPKIDG